jgi:hypothetical protein
VVDIGARVVVKSWNGTLRPDDEPTLSRENYWALIGKRGLVIRGEQEYHMRVNPDENFHRVLVRFDEDLRQMGLASHNGSFDPTWENALWVQIGDLSVQ